MSHVTYNIRRVSRANLPFETEEMARYLIGKSIVRNVGQRRIVCRIVETEAYPPGDSSGHGYRGETASNHSLFLGRGFAYVYFTYGTHYMLNVSSEKPGVGAGVLFRALEPLEGIKLIERGRKTETMAPTKGPGRLALALQIDKRLDGVDFCADGPLWLGAAVRPTGEIGASRRIGITREVERLLRFFEVGNPFVSGPKALSIK